MSFSVYDSDIALCSGDSVLLFNYDHGTKHLVTLPKLILNKDANLHNNVDIESFHAVTDVSFSDDGQYFLVCTNRKQLCLYDRKNHELVSNRTLPRAASKVRFTPNNDIVAADKSGDAYLFSTSRPEEQGTMLLGHLSMLLDILVTDNEKYILTSDRDEKIRVSLYPNCYNIKSYCLGHEKFVTNISELPHEKNILVSSGGDGCLRFWDYVAGRELLSLNVSENVNAADIQKFNENLLDCDLEESVTVLPVKNLSVSQLEDNMSIVIATLYTSRRIFVYIISGNIKDGLEVLHRGTVEFGEEPLACIVVRKQLWVLSEEGLKTYKMHEKQFIQDDVLDEKMKSPNESWRNLRANVNEQALFPILYKRKYDNVQGYQERKKSRLAKVVE